MTFDQTHWIPAQRRQPLSTYYYLDHFIEMLSFVEQHYAHVMLESHVEFIAAFQRLPRDAQCLYVRLVNRKGRVFAVDKLRYPELADVPGLTALLREHGWIGTPRPEHFIDLLRFLKKSEIFAALQPAFTGLSKTLKKSELVAFAATHCAPETFVDSLQTNRLCVQRRNDDVRYLLFLYFGRIQESLTQFTMRDLGLVRTSGLADSYEPRFSERDEAQEHYYFARQRAQLRQADPARLDALLAETVNWPEANFAGSAKIRDKLAFEVGRMAERAGRTDEALTVYGRGESVDCGEREVRLLLSLGRREEARKLLEERLETPRSDAEWLLCRDLYQRKFEKKRTSKLTDVLRAGETIDIDESRSGAPERAAVEYFEAQGLRAFRVENLLWRTFFGLLFWKELFSEAGAALNSPFEFLPAPLRDHNFVHTHAKQIEGRLALLDRPDDLKRELLKVSTQYYGTPNGVFRWRRSQLDALFALIDAADAAALRHILTNLCERYMDVRHGYPDLLVIDPRGARFVEIKTEGDQLRRNQLLRIRELRGAGLRADVVRVRWVLDPDQTYVVVDVETTGGRGEQHRITEIGAVRVRNGKIIDRFQTLLNPQRTIPPGITRLTGISAAMVQNAPCFVDVADEFDEFFKGAIFVAHNVEFDYRFIAAEFRRIGRPFRAPKLCTCASMRKLYPGHKSYSLAALCRTFDIPLKSHHRALCDAEAAAELLLLVNEKRQERILSGSQNTPAEGA
ncbi:MAG: VRR-NUC domain-containing protein [Woeseia sp.]|nr:VRR-NUC domain-containing protein [Woeseia sp.]